MKTTKRRGAVDYCNQVANPSPRFDVPPTHVSRLAFINDAVKKSHQVNVLLSDVAQWARSNNDRKKAFYKDRANAIKALVSCFAEHYNVITGQVQISLRNAADLCGLSTISQREKDKAEADPTYAPRPSISRVSRAFKDMCELGWVNAPQSWQIWDKAAHHWIDKIFELTPLFFKALGITPERVERVRQARLKYLAKKQYLGLTEQQLATTPLAEIKRIARHVYARTIRERRESKQALSKLKRQALNKTPAEQRAVATERVIKRLGARVKHLSEQLFSQEVNQEVALIRRLLTPAPA